MAFISKTVSTYYKKYDNIMSTKKLTSIILFFFVCIPANHLFAWGSTGHRVIAEVAQRNLDSTALAHVNYLLDNQSMAYWSNWPDFIKSDTLDTWKQTFVWHYINAPANMEKKAYINYIKSVKQGNVYSAINQMEEILKNKEAGKDDKKNALLFLIHLVGDMHQPMHAGRAEDQGGNKIRVFWFDKETNLHSLWDSQLINFENYSFSEYATILNVVTDRDKEELQNGTLEDWLYDSHTIANRIYDITPQDSKLAYDYNYKTKSIVENQLRKGGLRLAKILNDLW